MSELPSPTLRLEDEEPERFDPAKLGSLHPLAKKAICVFGFQQHASNSHDQYRWLWHEASVDKREEVLAALWKYPYVQDYLIEMGVVGESTASSNAETVVGFAVRDYVDLPEPIRFLTVYANGDGGLHPDHVGQHGLFLLSKQEIKGAMLPIDACRGVQTDTHPLVVNAGWAEN